MGSNDDRQECALGAVVRPASTSAGRLLRPVPCLATFCDLRADVAAESGIVIGFDICNISLKTHCVGVDGIKRAVLAWKDSRFSWE